ncbi:TRAP-type C4-dicarboxylate transport system, small permease component [Paucidesulfovibrio gracilis DSM 16080]|uniref:TRAP-type C4-dicarboxylate transport system, small permease component n=1 Tax=Paucidesulfovibrio gracilis DSM 16080 TaxID=1121449 RepID=A0A1T4WNQ6_9BACT|nr:TRAP transporter small permease [Paucidesulfovibrio gracilis]SKA78983.1 TRAP-type C4-dicarboxylate transport system, small permease component [Paucidesulfovibrio gracilis DSM 16080]
MLQSLFSALSGMRKVMRAVAATALCAMALVTGTDVVGRFWDSPLFGSEEIVTMLAVLVVGLSLPEAHWHRSHIGVEIFVRFLPKKVRDIIHLITTSAALGLFAVVAWRMVDYGLTMQTSGVRSMNLGFPEYLVVFVLAFGFLIFTLHLVRDVVTWFTASPETRQE